MSRGIFLSSTLSQVSTQIAYCLSEGIGNELKEIQSEMERKVHEIKLYHENEKQDIKRQHSRIHQDLLEETNQVEFHFSFNIK